MRTLPLLLCLSAAFAATPAQAAVHVTGWARPTVPGQTSAAAYVSVHNGGGAADRLLAVATPAAARASVHRTVTTGGIARMRAAGPLAIAPNGVLAMSPGGVHIMLSGLKAPLRAGGKLPLVLRFERAGTVRVSLPITMQGQNDRHAH